MGTTPASVAYDSGRGEIFVTNTGSANVSVISVATDTVVDSVSVGKHPAGAAYDSSKGEVFVANCDSDNVSVISDATDSVLASVGVGGCPDAMAYDSGKGEVFVANWDSNNVSVISDATNAVVATVPVGTIPTGVAYDSGKGEVFVANQVSQNVSVISDATETVVATVYANGATDLAYDSGRGEVFVAGGPTTVIADSDNQVVTTLTGLGGSNGMAYDSRQNLMLASDGTDTVLAYSDSWYDVVASPRVGTDPWGMAYDTAQGEFFIANQGSANVSVISITIPPPPTISSFTANPATVSVESSTNLTVVSAGGIGTVRFAYSGLPPGCVSSIHPSFVCWPTSTGSFEVRVFVNDTNGDTVNATTTVIVTPMSITAFQASPPNIALGGTAYLNATVSGGFAPWDYVYTLLPRGCTSSDTPSLACTPTAAGTFHVRIYVNDSRGETSNATATLLVTPMTIASFVASPSSLALGGTAYFNATVSGGFAPLSFAYVQLPKGCTSSNTSSLWCAPTETGSFLVRVYANDSAGDSATATTTFAVRPVLRAPTISSFTVASPESAVIYVGDPVFLNVTAQGDGLPLSYTYTDLPSGCATSNVSSLTCTPGEGGSFEPRVFVNDSEGLGATGTVGLVVAWDPQITGVVLVPTSPTLSEGATQGFTATVSCTVSPCWSGLSFLWVVNRTLGTLSSGNASTASFTAGSTVGSFSLEVEAYYHPLNSDDGFAIAHVTVKSPSASASGGIGLTELEGALLVVTVVTLIVALWLFILKRRKPKKLEVYRSTPESPGSGDSV